MLARVDQWLSLRVKQLLHGVQYQSRSQTCLILTRPMQYRISGVFDACSLLRESMRAL